MILTRYSGEGTLKEVMFVNAARTRAAMNDGRHR
jgi:hypothetical protein